MPRLRAGICVVLLPVCLLLTSSEATQGGLRVSGDAGTATRVLSAVDDMGDVVTTSQGLHESNVRPEYGHTEIVRVLEENETRDEENGEGTGQDGDTSDGEQPESDLVSSTPLTERGRVGLLTIILTITLTSTLLYYAYTHQFAILAFLTSARARLSYLPISSTSARLPTLSDIRSSISSFKLPTISMASPSRRRIRRLRRGKPKGGFRPHASRLHAWASEDGLFDGDHSSSSSNDADIENGGLGNEPLDLGADEDFMIGASRANARSPQKPATNTARWWTKPKSSKGSQKSSAGTRNVLFSVADGDDDIETDEGLPLAPSPHNYGYGLGSVRGYGSANSGTVGN